MVSIAAILSLVLAAASGALPKGAIVDLTHPFGPETIFWPTESGFVLEKEHDGPTEHGYYYRANKFSSPEHGGTHIDAPAHFAKDGNTLDAIPLEQLIGPAVMVDVSRKCDADRDYRISIDDFRDWEKAHRDEIYWGKPVPGFGDPKARMLLIALAPAAHGANRTGRVFTGDGPGGSGDFLMAA